METRRTLVEDGLLITVTFSHVHKGEGKNTTWSDKHSAIGVRVTDKSESFGINAEVTYEYPHFSKKEGKQINVSCGSFPHEYELAKKKHAVLSKALELARRMKAGEFGEIYPWNEIWGELKEA